MRIEQPMRPIIFGSQPNYSVSSKRVSASLPSDQVAISQPIRFGSKLDNNHGIKFPIEVSLDFDQSLQVQRAILVKTIEMLAKKDNSHLVFTADLISGRAAWPAAMNGLTDALMLSGVPIDTVVQAWADQAGLRVLLSGNGRRYMNQHATIDMHPLKAAASGKTKDARSMLRMFNEHQRNLEWKVMSASGKTNRAEVQRDLNSGDEYNALTCLAYGEKGLVDAVIVGYDELLTRSALNAFYKANGLSGKKNEVARTKFNKEYQSMGQVLQWVREHQLLETFEKTAPGSLCQNPTVLQKSVLDKDDNDKKPDSDKLAKLSNSSDDVSKSKQPVEVADLVKQLYDALGLNKAEGKEGDAETGKKEDEIVTKFHINGSNEGIKELDRTLTISKEIKTGMIEIQNVPESLKGSTFARDSVLFPGGFDINMMQTTEAALDKLYEKKERYLTAGKPVSNALIIENSPGGYIFVARQIRSKMQTAPVPTDVLVQGWGCSCGSQLVSFATGNRFATPSANILLHESSGGSYGELERVNQGFRDLEYTVVELQHLLADRTGRPYEEVVKDIKMDFELNAVESMVYGSKGLIDAILVAPDKVLTREVVMDFLIEKKGSLEAAQAYIEQKFVDKREGNYTADKEEHQEINEDPLANPIQMIKELVSRGKAVSMESVEQFRASVSDVAGDKEKTMHLYKVSEEPPVPH